MTEVVLTDVTLVWEGLTFTTAASGGVLTLDHLSGWEDLADGRELFDDRPSADGVFDYPVYARGRRVVASGWCTSAAERDTQLQLLGSTFVRDHTTLRDLTVTLAGRTLTAKARLTRYKPGLDNWAAGFFPWAAEWLCPDPCRYGALQTAGPVGFAVAGGGLGYPLYEDGALDYGDLGTSGRVTLANAGPVDSWPQYVIAGPVPADGFDIVEAATGDTLRFEGSVPSGSTLVIDDTGAVVLDGHADRDDLLTLRQWQPVPAGSSATWVFLPLGAATAATLTMSHRPAY